MASRCDKEENRSEQKPIKLRIDASIRLEINFNAFDKYSKYFYFSFRIHA